LDYGEFGKFLDYLREKIWKEPNLTNSEFLGEYFILEEDFIEHNKGKWQGILIETEDIGTIPIYHKFVGKDEAINDVYREYSQMENPEYTNERFEMLYWSFAEEKPYRMNHDGLLINVDDWEKDESDERQDDGEKVWQKRLTAEKTSDGDVLIVAKPSNRVFTESETDFFATIYDRLGKDCVMIDESQYLCMDASEDFDLLMEYIESFYEY